MFDLKLLKRIDWFTILLVVGLVTFGLISIASIMASPFSGEESSISSCCANTSSMPGSSTNLSLPSISSSLSSFCVSLVSAMACCIGASF
jgi:hypothetical protein